MHVSDPSRTIIDVLDRPALGGGIRHVADVLAEYVDSRHRDDELLLGYGDRLGNRTVFKRLGYLLEWLDVDAAELISACRQRRSTGISKLDPTINGPSRIVTRWNLRVNATLDPHGSR